MNKNGIIETLVEFAQEKAKGAEFEYDSDDWEKLEDCWTLSQLEGSIALGRIRVKPATITLYEYRYNGVARWSDNSANCFYVNGNLYKKTGRSIVSAPINEGG